MLWLEGVSNSIVEKAGLAESSGWSGDVSHLDRPGWFGA